MRNKKLTLLLVIDVVVASIALVFVLVTMWNKPLGPSLAQSNDSSSQPTATAVSSSVPVNDAPVEHQPATTSTPSSLLSKIVGMLSPDNGQVKTECEGPPLMYILLVGSDMRGTDYSYGLADTIRLVRIDFVSPGVTMLDFPRDLWVEIPGIADHYEITHAKLNQAYYFGSPSIKYYDGADGGPGLTAQTLAVNFGAHVDHYLAMNMKTFVRLIDAVNGVDIYLDRTVDMNPDQDGANPDKVYPQGYNHLDGAQALAFVRDRIPTIFQRARYQTMILNALEQKMLTVAMIPVWPQIISDFSNSVQTDLSPNEISQLVCLAKLLPGDKVTTVAFPDKMFTSASTYDPYRKVYTYTLDADFSQIRQYVADFMNGVWP
jgi:LCP family protein required for cell wall assembly